VSGARREEWGAGWEGCEVRRRRFAEGARGESQRRAHHEFREVRSDKQSAQLAPALVPAVLVVAALLAVAVASSSRVASSIQRRRGRAG